MPRFLTLFSSLSLLAACGGPVEFVVSERTAPIAHPPETKADRIPPLEPIPQGPVGVVGPLPELWAPRAAPVPQPQPNEQVKSRPGDGEIGVARDQALLLTFSEPMDPIATEAAIELVSDLPQGAVAAVPSWNDDFTRVTLELKRPLEYGSNITWSVSTKASTARGQALATRASGTFRAIRLEARQLMSVGPLDGSVDSLGNVQSTGAAFTIGDATPARFIAGFLTFDLSALDPAATQIISAELAVFQADLAGLPYSLGPMLATGIDYGAALDASDLYAPAQRTQSCPDCAFVEETRLLSTSVALGFKVAPATAKVASDWANRVALDNRSQYRLTFRKPTNDDDRPDLAWLYACEQGSRAPALRITYEVP